MYIAEFNYFAKTLLVSTATSSDVSIASFDALLVHLLEEQVKALF